MCKKTIITLMIFVLLGCASPRGFDPAEAISADKFVLSAPDLAGRVITVKGFLVPGLPYLMLIPEDLSKDRYVALEGKDSDLVIYMTGIENAIPIDPVSENKALEKDLFSDKYRCIGQFVVIKGVVGVAETESQRIYIIENVMETAVFPSGFDDYDYFKC